MIREDDLIGIMPHSQATALDVPELQPLGDRILLKVQLPGTAFRCMAYFAERNTVVTAGCSLGYLNKPLASRVKVGHVCAGFLLSRGVAQRKPAELVGVERLQESTLQLPGVPAAWSLNTLPA